MAKKQEGDFVIRAEVNQDKILELAPELNSDEYNIGLIAMLQQALEETAWENRISDPKHLRLIPGYTAVPMICKTNDCPFAEYCPIMRELSENFNADEIKSELYGNDCRVDQLEAALMFAGLIKDLEIKPENTIDLMTVTSLVTNAILLRRIGWSININGVMISQVAAVTPDGFAHYNKIANSLLKERKIVQDQIDSLIKQLAASREEKIKAGSKDLDDLRSFISKKRNAATINKVINVVVDE